MLGAEPEFSSTTNTRLPLRSKWITAEEPIVDRSAAIAVEPTPVASETKCSNLPCIKAGESSNNRSPFFSSQ